MFSMPRTASLELAMKKCKRCGKRWCGTKRRTKKLYPDEPWMWNRTYGSRKCRDKAAARRR